MRTRVAAAMLALTGATAGAQAGTDIFLVPLTRAAGAYQTAGEARNITARAGYDNQPHFEPDRESLLFTSGRDGDTDIYRYDILTGRTEQLTETSENEYSPTVTPDRRGFSVIRGTQQFLERFDRSGKNPTVILPGIIPVGYHAWVDEENVVLFVLGEPNTLRHARVRTGLADTVFESPGRSLQPIPGRRAVSAVQRRGNDEFWVVAYELDSREIRPIVRAVSGSAERDHAWTPDGVLLMTAGNAVYQFDPRRDTDWRPLATFGAPGMMKLTRLAVSPDGQWLALVGDEI